MTVIYDMLTERLAVWSDVVGHLQFLYETVVEQNAQVVVELGARSGNSTVALLAGVEVTGGLLYSVDIETPQWPLEVWDHPQITFLKGDDLALREQVPNEIDVLYIDTSHTELQTLAELRLYGPSAKVILMHDTDLDHPYGAPAEPAYPVRTAMRAWCDEVDRPYYEREGSYGLGVIGT